ncbi:POLYKETIDE CYCLASE/DEHYDRASE AND LIPID TRANSPORT SUPERFAMILY PROTEIN [Salix viminalis]|uniref:POLYKETIDE CYCLASE/DEHYDRASE AND LIPID TRANSPORT SUPERFAMILY PROTEIN n=1 Tax=Salix viminalis TaxID=40686 RepID=A0A9Q0QHP2_SALVM|nr:POLYKETIDE CYCLASE/DEHYDRASE AND LIPID TRANSPORT SUPERFAMILY PROTEIN [Salix viminalis]
MSLLHAHVYETPAQAYAPVRVLSCAVARSTKVIETRIQCSTGSFYKFFKKQASLLPSVCGAIVQTVGLADGNRSWVNTVGSRKVIEILAADSCADTAEKFKYVVDAVDDRAKKITYKVLEGSLLQTYDSFTVTLQVTSGSTAKWTVEYVKKDPCGEDPDFYLDLFRTINATVDVYLRSNDY